MPWPETDGFDDLAVLIAAARAPGARRCSRDVLPLLAGILAAKPDAAEADVANVLHWAGFGPKLWAEARQALEAPAAPRIFRSRRMASERRTDW